MTKLLMYARNVRGVEHAFRGTTARREKRMSHQLEGEKTERGGREAHPSPLPTPKSTYYVSRTTMMY